MSPSSSSFATVDTGAAAARSSALSSLLLLLLLPLLSSPSVSRDDKTAAVKNPLTVDGSNWTTLKLWIGWTKIGRAVTSWCYF